MNTPPVTKENHSDKPKTAVPTPNDDTSQPITLNRTGIPIRVNPHKKVLQWLQDIEREEEIARQRTTRFLTDVQQILASYQPEKDKNQ